MAAQVMKGLAVIMTTLCGPFGALHGGYYLLESSLGPLLEESIHTFVQVVRSHEVVDNSEARHIDGMFVIFGVDVVGHAVELAGLLDNLDEVLGVRSLQ